MMKLNEKGQSLVEALIALGVAAIVVSAMAVAAITSVNNADFSKYQNLATNYAQQGLEVLRQQAQSNWSLFTTQVPAYSPEFSGKTYCLDQTVPLQLSPLNSLGACDPTPNVIDNGKNFFLREVTLTQTASSDLTCHGSVLANVSVAWTDGKCGSVTTYCHNVTLQSCFANINGVLGK